MAFISIVLIIAGFIISVYGGVVLSLSNKVRKPSGELDFAKINFYSIVMAISVLMVIAGTIGYYFLRGNLPYYING